MENEVFEFQLVWQGKACSLFCGFAKIYILRDVNQKVFYVGATVDSLNNRLKNHISYAKNDRGNRRKNAVIINSNFDITIDQVDIIYVTGHDRSGAVNKAAFLEYHWICKYKELGYDLTNNPVHPKMRESPSDLLKRELQEFLNKSIIV